MSHSSHFLIRSQKFWTYELLFFKNVELKKKKGENMISEASV